MMAVIGFSQGLVDMGISSAVIQSPTVSKTQLSSLYWFNIFTGILIFFIVFAITPLVSAFFNIKALLQPLRYVSIIFIIAAIGNQYRILSQKELKFKKITVIDVISTCLGTVVTLVAAKSGLGINAIVIGMIVQVSISSIAFLVIGLIHDHKPSVIYKHQEIKKFLYFGIHQTGGDTINYITSQMDKILIGKILGLEALGFYNMAWQLTLFPLTKINPILNKVAFPIYSKVQNIPLKLSSYYQTTVKGLSLITIPLLSFLCFFSYEIVITILGPGWDLTSQLVRTLSFVGILKTMSNPGGPILIAKGHPEVGFWWNLTWGILLSFFLFLGLSIAPKVQTAPVILLICSLTFGGIWHYIIAKFGNIKYQKIIFEFIKIMTVAFIIAFISHSCLMLTNIHQAVLKILFGCGIFLGIYIIYLIKFERTFIQQFGKGKN